MKEVIIISFATDGFGKPLNDLSTIHAALKDQVEEYNPKIWVLAKGPSESYGILKITKTFASRRG